MLTSNLGHHSVAAGKAACLDVELCPFITYFTKISKNA